MGFGGRGGNGPNRGGGHSHYPGPNNPYNVHQNQGSGGWSFSWMNIIPIYTLCIVGYAVYIYFKVKNRTPEEKEERKSGIKKSELSDLKERLARTEAALHKLMEATNKMLDKKYDEKDLMKLLGDQKVLEKMLQKEEEKIAESQHNSEDETNDIEEKSVHSQAEDSQHSSDDETEKSKSSVRKRIIEKKTE